jgi:Dolichyl-phosphate-mannose-protein mannosyltransferase
LPQTLGAALALPAAFVLLLLPGLSFLSLLRRSDRDRLGFDERLFLAGAVSVAFSSWVALLLAEIGVFGTVRAAVFELIVLAVVFALARLAGRRPEAPFARPTRPSNLIPALLVAVVAFLLHARPSEYIVGGRDPGAYVSAMGVIARTGAITHKDPVVASIPAEDLSLFYANLDEPPFKFTLEVNEDRPQPSWPRFMGFELDHPSSGLVTPQFFHLFPAFGAYLFETMGVRGALATSPIFGILGTLASFFLARRMFGPTVALVAALGLAATVLQVWFARYPVSEGFSQFLILSGLLAHRLDQECDSRAFAWLSGGLLGLTLLVRIDSVLLLVPLLFWAGLQFARRGEKWKARLLGLLVPFILLFGHAALHALFFSKRYAHQILTRRYWNHPLSVWLIVLVAALAAAYLVWKYGPACRARLQQMEGRLRVAAMVSLGLLAAYSLALRPALSAWAGGDGNPKAEALQDPSLLQSLGFQRLAAHDAQALVRYSWFVGPPVLALAFLGLFMFLKKADSSDILALAVFLAFSIFYLYKIRVFNDYFFAMRRYMPVTLPFTFILAAFALVTLARRSRRWRLGAITFGILALGVSVSHTMPIVTYTDWKGSVRFVADVARRFGPRDVVLFEQPKNIHLLSLPLWGLFGANALEFRRFNPDPERLSHLIAAWRKTYRNIYFVTSFRTDVCGLFLERTQNFRFTSSEFEWTYDRVPRKPQARVVEFFLSRVIEPETLRVTTDPRIDIGGSGDLQTSGFFEKEATGERTYRWTGGCLDEKGNATGSVYVPAAAPGARLRIHATAHLRPENAKAARVRVTFDEVPVGEFTADGTWRDFEVTLPDPLPDGSKVLRLETPAWRPSNTDRLATDTRDLGIMVDFIEVLPRAPRS